ncbi:ScbR family autoregulator-binding transcription factor [Streptomyces sp. NPDC006355]|uniref:ScbR family autoregulator-binding transcription factor n=1 Tax=Streptomyces sp. NPDC006355 TaxID=3156758 RepID=UPI0033B9B3A5
MALQERAIRTRRAILVAAAEVFDELGYEAATITEILKRSGLTRGALYFHFSSKEELAQAVLAVQVEALPSVAKQDLKLQESMDEALLLAYLLRRKTGDPIVRGGVRLTVDQGAAQAGLDTRAPMRAWVEHTHALLNEAKTNGELLPHVDTLGLAKLTVGAFTGIQVLSNIMTDREDMPERVTDLYRNLMAATAVPSVLSRMDFGPGRGMWVYHEAMKLRQAEAEPEVAQGAVR